MEKEITYLGIESVKYYFTKNEVLVALLENYNIRRDDNYEFNLFEAYEDEPEYAELIIRYSEKKDGASK